MLKWYQEPLVHFLILGSFLFFLIQTIHTPASMHSDKTIITLSKKEIKQMLLFWQNKYHTLPTQEELHKLFETYIEKEILYAEAKRMQLDKNDTAIKQILIDKLKYIASEPLDIGHITDRELQTFYQKNKRLFADKSERYISFAHIYFNPKKYESSRFIEEKAHRLYQKIKTLDLYTNYADKGDSFYKGSYFSHINTKELTSVFSHSFVQSLLKLPQKRWSKPLKSGYGLHLVYIENIDEKKATFASLKEQIKDRYIIHKSQEAYRQFYQNLKKKYRIVIEPYSAQNKE